MTALALGTPGSSSLPLAAVSSEPSDIAMPVLNWQEPVQIPQVDRAPLAAKLDTGAMTSALHASRIRTFDRGGARWVRFETRGASGERRIVETPIVGTRRIRSSNGAVERRYVVRMQVRLGPRVLETDFTLADRSEMDYPVLIGRRALTGNFLVRS